MIIINGKIFKAKRYGCTVFDCHTMTKRFYGNGWFDLAEIFGPAHSRITSRVNDYVKIGMALDVPLFPLKMLQSPALKKCNRKSVTELVYAPKP